MEELINLAGGVGRLVAIFGGALSAVFIGWAGVLWMLSAGDPQGMAKARMALIGAIVGLVVIGASFLVPGIVSEVVIEPVGGMPVRLQSAYDCDAVLRTQLVNQVNVNTAKRIQGLIQRIQAQRQECRPEIWSPVVKADDGMPPGCEDSAGSKTIEGMEVPDGLRVSPGGAITSKSRRDGRNNVMVYWAWSGDGGEIRNLPSDSAVCWMYRDDYRAWFSGRAG